MNRDTTRMTGWHRQTPLPTAISNRVDAHRVTERGRALHLSPEERPRSNAKRPDSPPWVSQASLPAVGPERTDTSTVSSAADDTVRASLLHSGPTPSLASDHRLVGVSIHPSLGNFKANNRLYLSRQSPVSPVQPHSPSASPRCGVAAGVPGAEVTRLAPSVFTSAGDWYAPWQSALTQHLEIHRRIRRLA